MQPSVRVGLVLVRAYQLLLSPFAGGACRFTPSCSAYALEAIETHGLARGMWLAIRRVARIVTKGRFALSAVSIGLGVVLPPESTFAMWVGALIFWIMGRRHRQPGTRGYELDFGVGRCLQSLFKERFGHEPVLAEGLHGRLPLLPVIVPQVAQQAGNLRPGFVGHPRRRAVQFDKIIDRDAPDIVANADGDDRFLKLAQDGASPP